MNDRHCYCESLCGGTCNKCADEMGEEIHRLEAELDLARAVGRDLLRLGVCVSDMEKMQLLGWLERYPWLGGDSE